MPAPPNNQFWKQRSSHGRKPLFETPEDLWLACTEYFEWVEENPLYEEKAFSHKDGILKSDLYKMRAMTKGGLCIFLDISPQTFENYKEHTNDKEIKDFLGVCEKVDEIIRDQKFTGAAAGLLNPSIIARDLGLRDNQDVTTNGEALGGLFQVELVSATETKD